MESGIAAFFIVLLVYKLYEFEMSWRKEEASTRQIATLAVIAVLTMFSRLDLVFLAGMVGLWVVFRGHLLRFFLPLDIASIIILTILRDSCCEWDLTVIMSLIDIALAMAVVALLVKIPCCLFCLVYISILASSRIGELLKRVVLFAVTGSVVTGILVLLVQRLGLGAGFLFTHHYFDRSRADACCFLGSVD